MRAPRCRNCWGGKYGEMSTLGNYLFQSFNFRSKNKLRPFYSLVAARQYGLTFLQVESSVTAEAFYQSLGYKVRERGEHTLRGRIPMACVKMEKQLVT